MKSDQELIKDFQKGNNRAFDILVEKHLYNTIGFFIKITGNQSEAEDLAQDVFIKMYKALKKFKFGAKFKTYLYRSNVNMANSYFRSKKWKNILNYKTNSLRGGLEVLTDVRLCATCYT